MSDWDVTLLQPETSSNIAFSEVVEILASLVDKCLVVADGDRYRLLETVRQYGRGRLNDVGESGSIRDRHLSCFLALVEQAEPQLTGPDQQPWLQRLDAENDNLRAALDWSLKSMDDAESGLRMCGAIWPFWSIRGYFGEGRHRLSLALNRPTAPNAGQNEGHTARARALNGAGFLAFRQGDYSSARAMLNQGLAMGRAAGDVGGIAASLSALGSVATGEGNYPAARELYEESLAMRRELGDSPGVANSLNNLGNVAHAEGNYPLARTLYEESLAIRRGLGDRHAIAMALDNLGDVARAEGNYGAARPLLEESLAIGREVANRPGIAGALKNLGNVAYAEGDHTAAQSLHRESLMIKRELGDRLGIAESLEPLGGLSWAAGQPERAARLWGAAETLREAIGARRHAYERFAYDRDCAAVRKALGDAAFDSAFALGRAMTCEQAVEYALQQEPS